MIKESKRNRRVKVDTDSTKSKQKKAGKKFDTKGETKEVAQDIGNRKKFHDQDLVSIAPKNERQEEFFYCYYSNTPIILLDGYPGVGKSFLATYVALRDIFDTSTPYEKLVIVRSAVESGTSIGFLPGTEEEKMEPFEAPYKAITSEVMSNFKNPYDHLKSLGYLDFMLTIHARGINLDNSIILIEEAQCMDYDELKTIITRTGVNSRVIITGDENQDDLKRKRRKSGMSRLKDVFVNMKQDSVGVINFKKEDIVRSGLVKEFIIADFETEET